MKNIRKSAAGHIASIGTAAILMMGLLPAVGNVPGVPVLKSAAEDYTVSAGSRVYYAYHSKCYHVNRSCRTLRRSRTVYRTTLKGARAKGLRPCRVCTR